MGGHQGGEVASAIAVETLEAVITEPTVDSVVDAVKEANRRIFARAADDDDLRGMGTTLVAIALVNRGGDDEEVAWINVGDSRAYLLRDGELTQLSQDHSLVEDLRRGGQLSEEEAAVHPQRNILTRALGIDHDVQVDTGSLLPFTGDRFLLCSDGLFNEVDRDTIIETMVLADAPDDAAADLVRLANAGGGRDNITCVVVDVTDDGGRSAHAAEAAAAAAASAAAAAGRGGRGRARRGLPHRVHPRGPRHPGRPAHRRCRRHPPGRASTRTTGRGRRTGHRRRRPHRGGGRRRPRRRPTGRGRPRRRPRPAGPADRGRPHRRQRGPPLRASHRRPLHGHGQGQGPALGLHPAGGARRPGAPARRRLPGGVVVGRSHLLRHRRERGGPDLQGHPRRLPDLRPHPRAVLRRRRRRPHPGRGRHRHARAGVRLPRQAESFVNTLATSVDQRADDPSTTTTGSTTTTASTTTAGPATTTAPPPSTTGAG